MEEPFCVSEKIRYGEKVWIGMGRKRVSRFSVEIVLSHSTETFGGETFLCFRYFLVSKNVREERVGYHDFPSKSFWLTLSKRFLEETFRVSENSISKTFVQKREKSQFPVENCLSHSTDELLRGTPLCFRNFWLSK